MASVNKVILVGNLGAGPTMRYTPKSTPVAELRVATSRSWKEGDDWKEKTEWHRVTCWRHLAERADKYAHKGSQVYVEGYIDTEKWQDDSGKDRYTTKIIAEKLLLLGKKEDAAQEQPAAFKPPPMDDAKPGPGDDLPF